MAKLRADETRFSLLLRVTAPAAGNAEWSEFMAIYQPWLYRNARRLARNEHNAQDLTGEVLRKVFKTLPAFVTKYDPAGSFRAWLKTLVRHAWADWYRKEGHHPPHGTSECADVILDQLTDGWSESLEADVEVSRKIDKVRNGCSEKEWAVLWQTYAEGKEAAVVAEDLGLEISNVFQIKSRAMRRLKEAGI